jgi:hypothetical protein
MTNAICSTIQRSSPVGYESNEHADANDKRDFLVGGYAAEKGPLPCQ